MLSDTRSWLSTCCHRAHFAQVLCIKQEPEYDGGAVSPRTREGAVAALTQQWLPAWQQVVELLGVAQRQGAGPHGPGAAGGAGGSGGDAVLRPLQAACQALTEAASAAQVRGWCVASSSCSS